MSFKIKATGAVFEWKKGALQCSDDRIINYLKDILEIHEPETVILPDMINYDDDLTDGRNAYLAILDIFQDAEVLEKPDEDFLNLEYDKDVVYYLK